MSKRFRRLAMSILLAAGLSAGASPAQEASAPPPPRPPEGSVIINLPSADTNPAGSLQFLITHRFQQPVQDSDIHSIYSFFSPANVGLGLSYAPARSLEAGFLRTPDLEDYELFAKYSLYAPAEGAFHAGLRIGGDNRSAKGLSNRWSFFAQGILALMVASRVRVTAVPTYVSRTAAVYSVTPLQNDVFNVPVAVSISVTRSFNVQGEVVPRHLSAGTGWIAAIEKTVLRHRFSFSVGNMLTTSVDQSTTWQPQFIGASPRDLHFGFNIVRLWKLK